MTGASANRWHHVRLARAVVVVCAIVLAAPLIDGAAGAAAAEPPNSIPAEGIHAGELLAGGDAETALARIEHRAETADDALSEASAWFLEEIGFLPNARDVRWSGSVAGYVVDDESAAVFGQLRLHMQRRGWRCVPLGDVDGATFLKGFGQCSWALATCTQVGEATSVVIRLNGPYMVGREAYDSH